MGGERVKGEGEEEGEGEGEQARGARAEWNEVAVAGDELIDTVLLYLYSRYSFMLAPCTDVWQSSS